MTQYRYTGALEIIECHSCHMHFGVLPEFKEYKLKNRNNSRENTFYCPSGHPQYYIGQSEEEKLRQERDRLKQNTAYLESRLSEKDERIKTARHAARAYKGHATKIRNRIKGGACPCCNRSFQNLSAHMKTQHPEFGGAPKLKEKA